MRVPVLMVFAGVGSTVNSRLLLLLDNMVLIKRYSARSEKPLPPGRHDIEVVSTIEKPGPPSTVIISVDGHEVAMVEMKRTVPLAFTATETFDVGIDLGSPVSISYAAREPFNFDIKKSNWHL